MNNIILYSGIADRGIATITKISSTSVRNSNEEISVNKNPPHHSLQTNTGGTVYENVQQATTPDETLM